MRYPWIPALLLFVLPGTAAAQSLRSEMVDLHGFGGWSYGRTNVNRYLGTDTLGSYAKSNFAVKVGAAIHPTVQISAQVHWKNVSDASDANLDYAFAEWRIADGLGLRAGKVKQPFGIYSEVAGIGTVRPFLNLSPPVYGPLGLISRSYRGVGIRASRALGSGWSAALDAYGGGIEFEQEESLLEWLYNPVIDSVTDFYGDIRSSRDVAGARLVVGAPVQGVSLGFSTYTGINNGIRRAERYYVFGGQFEYLGDRIWLRSEIVHQSGRFGRFEDVINASYVELAAFATDRLQPAIQYNRGSLDINAEGLPAESYDDFAHREWVFGLNYWVRPELGFKVSWHEVDGSLISTLTPEKIVQMLLTGVSPEPRTRLLQAGVQFSF